MTEPVSPADALACAAVVLGFYAASDARDAAAAADSFTDDGVWHRLGIAIEGRARIAEALGAREPGRTTAHIVTNLRIVPENDRNRASAHFLTTVYAQSGDEPPQLISVLISHDSLLRVGTLWRIACKRSRRHLPRPAPRDE